MSEKRDNLVYVNLYFMFTKTLKLNEGKLTQLVTTNQLVLLEQDLLDFLRLQVIHKGRFLI